MTERIKSGIGVSTLIAGIALVIAASSFVMAWYVSFTRPKLVPKPHLVITVSRTTSEPHSAILVQNAGEAIAHDLVLYADFPAGAEITLLEKGVFDLVEGGISENFVKLKKDQVGPGVSLPYVILTAKKNNIFIEPTLYAESREILKIPIHLMREM